MVQFVLVMFYFFGGEQLLIVGFCVFVYFFCLLWMFLELVYCLVKCGWLVGWYDQVGFVMDIDVVGVGVDFVGDYWFVVYCVFQQGDIECFGM